MADRRRLGNRAKLYKGESTCKVLIGITPGGSICFISKAFAGRVSDENLVKESGLVDKLIEMGLPGKGMHVWGRQRF